MSNKQTRGRPSKIDLLPQAIRDQLHSLLRDKRHTQEDIRAAVNELIDEEGLPDTLKISRTGLNRYASRMETLGARIREGREIADVWVSRLGSAPSSDVGKLLQEFVKSLAFETSMKLAEGGEPVEPKALSQLALVAARIEQAAMTSTRREKEIRAVFAAEAAEQTETLVKQAGLTAEAAADIKRQILGIA
ncbi:DUF3486 family protein [Photorhabdus bodei]|uniref:DUF3486 family protein n=1 Tax=Photorhabdus bodei TaxID=2029681 RepID=A0AAW6BP15_9GAMM|nr:DUF3486 family protein [Photorhabdus bodei]MDB6374425.1 DUF3486 family protein [Photorhabdus bodei]